MLRRHYTHFRTANDSACHHWLSEDGPKLNQSILSSSGSPIPLALLVSFGTSICDRQLAKSTHLMAKMASASGRHGLSTILQTREDPLPFRSDSRVVDACAMILPPLPLSAMSLLPESKRRDQRRQSLHWLFGICLCERPAIDRCYDLIRHDNSNAELHFS